VSSAFSYPYIGRSNEDGVFFVITKKNHTILRYIEIKLKEFKLNERNHKVSEPMHIKSCLFIKTKGVILHD
jgi:hypothetical protein